MSAIQVEDIDHVALAVRNVEQSARWYQETLGLQRLYQDAWGSYPAVVGIGSTAIALFPVQSEDPKPSPERDVIAMRHLAFRATGESFSRAQDLLQSRGIQFEFQDHDIAHSIYFEDPDGHRLEITTYDIDSGQKGGLP